MKLESLLAQAGLCKSEPTGAISTPIYQTSTFRHPALGKSTGYDYSRTINPTRKVLEDLIAKLESGDKGFAFSSGMAAITAITNLFKSGDHIIVSDDLYGGTYRLFEAVYSRFGIKTTYIDSSDIAKIEQAITPATRAVFIETPTNPLMKITDIRKAASLAKKHNLLTIVDNTFMTPFYQRPIELGADIVVHSGTKYLSGHNDVLCGFVMTATENLSQKIGFIQNATGGVLSPSDSWLVIRGLKTLAIRMERSEYNATKIARWLLAQKSVSAVYFPGLESHPGHDLHGNQSTGYGSMISFRIKNAKEAEKVINGVKLISFAESLGGVESLITYPCVQTHGDIPLEMRNRIGVTDDLLRLSIGIEHIDDLVADLDQAINGSAV
jgi:cystathionine gamma-synthase